MYKSNCKCVQGCGPPNPAQQEAGRQAGESLRGGRKGGVGLGKQQGAGGVPCEILFDKFLPLKKYIYSKSGPC